MMDVLIAGGGTGGHVFPGVAVAQECRRRAPDSRILFVGSARGLEVKAIPQAGFELELLGVSGLRRAGPVGLAQGLLRLPLALTQAFGIVRRFRPQVAVSVGGYAAGPAVLAAWLSRIPCVVLEQNAVAGTTNRILGKLAGRIVTAMPARGFNARKVHLLGNPVRPELLSVRDAPFVLGPPWRVLVLGGSAGASVLNRVVPDAAAVLGSPADVHWHHQTGRASVEEVRAAYARAGVPATVVPFIEDMASAYGAAQLVVCRAGATTIAELGICGRPSVLVPFPYAVDDHQTENAKVLERLGAALLMPQGALTAQALADALRALFLASRELEDMARNARASGTPDALTRIVDLLEEEAHVSR